MTRLYLAAGFATAMLWGLAQPAADIRAAQGDGGPAGPAASAAPGLILELRQSGGSGPYLVDGEGRALYLFSRDRQETREGATESRCHDLCTQHWVPVAVPADGTMPKAPRPDLLAVMRRADGLVQLTYNGWPLYYRAADAGGDAPPAALEAFGGHWSLVGPEGEQRGESRT
ncbi:hypothetical protein ACFOGJ_24625 [Marinibaculum pumilum]|uniref:Lipoprotein n=1 Tax=Marinibaculum pumilum TaxID=1766165 RepID=A0ABV7L723_9PROT